MSVSLKNIYLFFIVIKLSRGVKVEFKQDKLIIREKKIQYSILK
jgi:hypothetical protein